ncbi:Zn(2)-C6 fungal-type domain-containing protein [Fusarium sp. LHS14.1]|nr:Zn(2)-C6 fungal-type domain-containing protein [Fusarium sp. LHS14.1]
MPDSTSQSSTPNPVQQIRKRQRTESSYPRRRSVTACTVCRGRKSKCDNKRPSCSFCLGVGATCVYEELRSDFSNYDSASLHIINRLDYLERRMEERFDGLASQRTDMPEETFVKPSVFPTAQYPAAEGTLEWPVFEGLGLQLHGRSLALIHQDNHQFPSNSGVLPVDSRGNGQVSSSAGVDIFKDALPSSLVIESAIKDFLANVHTKNPILDPATLAEAAEDCIKNGIGNSVQAALVLIACALGIISSPYTPSTFDKYSPVSPDKVGTSRQLGESCFARCRTILSNQPLSLLSTQCHFFCGVYEMYSIRPVAAWLQFSQASLQLKLHIQSRSFSPNEFQTDEGRLLQRLYWSCMQSECELANELRVTSSGLEDLPFPYAFPHPPESSTSPTELDDESPGNRSQLNSWMYYLSETSLRRIGNEIIWNLYDQSPTAWMRDIVTTQRRAEQLDQKITAWVSNLPKALRVEEPIFESTNELGLHVRSRYLTSQAWIFQPFLYFMIHAPQTEILKHRKDIEPLAFTCLEASMGMINDATHHHRHHGTWYTARIAFGAALCLLAAARVNSIAMPPGWKASVQQAMHVLSRWSAESRNLQVSLEILRAEWDAVSE